MVLNGDQEYTAAHSKGATDLADAGHTAKSDPKTDEFDTFGVFAMVGEGETKSTNIFQLAVSEARVIPVNQDNALTGGGSRCGLVPHTCSSEVVYAITQDE